MDVARLIILPSASILDAIAEIDRGRVGGVVVVDEARRLLGVVTDGDVRRALLARVDLAAPVQVLLDRRARDLYPEPVAAPAAATRPERVALMQRHKIRHLPLLDATGRVVDVELLDRIVNDPLDVSVLVMAGGYGRRLRPLTDTLPKPMLPVGSKPLLEHMLAHLAEVGIRDVTIATHYLSDAISGYFGDGAALGVRIQYVDELEPLGTAGALRLVPTPATPLLVVNGDILTRVDVASMVRFHREHGASLTIGVRTLEAEVPYGVVEVRGEDVVSVLEKPTTLYFVNAGLYIVEPAALASLPSGQEPSGRIDMPDFIGRLLAERQRVVGFPVREYWMDIGHPEKYAQAQADFAEGRY